MSGFAADAAADAERAAADAGVRIDLLDSPAETSAAAEVLHAVWPNEAGKPMPAELMRAMAHADSYVAGVYVGDELVGAAAAFHVRPASLHSHITGVLSTVRGRSVGYALKMHQRAWALERGIGHILWTFDPLIRRNAHFNINKLGATAYEYLPDFYGPMTDAVNAGDQTDRLHIRWDLAAEHAGRGWLPEQDGAVVVATAADGGPVLTPAPPDAPRLLVELPADVEALRERDKALALRWRTAVREALLPAMSAGYTITGLASPGTYVLEHP
ncbi:GNAT family N-acetyltransferase [Pseudonocardia sp. TRM90224]|uniref:GNAT family N-acetyltransferase n=1 Tax=Pseudonocardia sp. TRM90224 TaxID=2812678 RepID=UPI001E2DCF97|nr:GNAT family N-acetyltransferase [Pseudonocardia sp. TRM90224]